MKTELLRLTYPAIAFLLGLLFATQAFAQSGSRNAVPAQPNFAAPSVQQFAPPVPQQQNFASTRSYTAPATAAPSSSCPNCSAGRAPVFSQPRNVVPPVVQSTNIAPQTYYSAPRYAAPVSQPIYPTTTYSAPTSAPIYSAPVYSRPVVNHQYYRPVRQAPLFYRSSPPSCSGY